jgi:hypothetical protein
MLYNNFLSRITQIDEFHELLSIHICKIRSIREIRDKIFSTFKSKIQYDLGASLRLARHSSFKFTPF